MVAVTFNDPEAIISNPEVLSEYTASGVGVKAAEGVAQFLRAVTSTRSGNQVVVGDAEDPIAPFTLLRADSSASSQAMTGWDYEAIIQAAEANAPGVIENREHAKRALIALLAAPHRGMDNADRRAVSPFYTYHLDTDGEKGWSHKKRVAAITFNDPQAIVSRTEQVRQRTPELGQDGARALAQLVTALTRTQAYVQ